MSLAEKIEKAKQSLKAVDIERTLEDGTTVVERKTEDGGFERVKEEPSVSNRRKKKVERLAKRGFVVDLTPDMQCAQVAEGLYLGSQDVAADMLTLRNNGITHIVNCATGVPNHFPSRFRYLSLEILDLPSTDIRSYFPEAHTFMETAIGKGGKVFVHCNAGISRAATIIISYIMKHQRLSAHETLEKVKEIRPGM